MAPTMCARFSFAALLVLTMSTRSVCYAQESQPSSGGKSTEGSADQNIAIPLGPLKFTIGPQGSTLKGNVSNQVYHWPLQPKPACTEPNSPLQATCSDLYGVLNFDVDANWAPGGGSDDSKKNSASLSFSPSFYWMLQNKNDQRTSHIYHEQLDKHNKSCNAYLDKFKVDKPKATASDVLDARLRNSDCLWAGDVTYKGIVAVSAYPEVEYRYGHFDISGTSYSANQLALGGGVRAFYPGQLNVALSDDEYEPLFVNWPSISAGYYAVENYHLSNIPAPTSDIQDHYFVVEERSEIFVPGFEKMTGTKAVVSVDVTESLPTSGSNPSGWRVARTFQLSFNTKGTLGLKPAVTYKSGEDKGLTYERQIIFGVLWDIWNQDRPN